MLKALQQLNLSHSSSLKGSTKLLKLYKYKVNNETCVIMDSNHACLSTDPGAPNENIVKNHLNVALLNVF